MNNGRDFVEVRSNGSVFPKRGTNPRTLYAHQTEAMRCMDRINQEPSYSTLIVLPTGGGKTYTAALWLLKNAIDRKRRFSGLPIVRCCWIRRRSRSRPMPMRK